MLAPILASSICMLAGAFLARQFLVWRRVAPAIDERSFAWRFSRACLPGSIGLGLLAIVGVTTGPSASAPRSLQLAVAALGVTGIAAVLLGIIVGITGRPRALIPRAMRRSD